MVRLQHTKQTQTDSMQIGGKLRYFTLTDYERYDVFITL